MGFSGEQIMIACMVQIFVRDFSDASESEKYGQQKQDYPNNIPCSADAFVK